MSIWTHARGKIVIESLNPITDEEFQKTFKTVLEYEDSRSEWDYGLVHKAEYTPFGSEGGIHYIIEWEEQKVYKSSVYVYEITIGGALRDFDNLDEIQEWFESILYESGWNTHKRFIKQGELTIECCPHQREIRYGQKKGTE